MSYSIDTITDNCYEGTTCLINKLDIQDEKQLDIVESQITVAKIQFFSITLLKVILILNTTKQFINSYLKIYMIGQEFQEL